MSKATIVIDGAGVTAALAAHTITDINTVAFSLFGERDEINLTTIDATKFKQKLLGDLQKVTDIVINKKSDPINDPALYSTDVEALVINYFIGKATNKKVTYYAQLKSINNSTVERAPGDGVNVDLNFYVSNLKDAAMTETAPVIAAGP